MTSERSLTVVPILGVIGSGKTYTSEQLQKTIFPNAEVIHFADELRNILGEIFLVEIETSGGPEWEKFKNANITVGDRVIGSGRDMAINISNVFKKYNRPDIFGKIVYDRIRENFINRDDSLVVIIPDLRFIEEFILIDDLMCMKNHTYNVEIIPYFTNYKSDRYDRTKNSPEEYLAQFLVYLEEKTDGVLTSSSFLYHVLQILSKNKKYLETQPDEKTVTEFLSRLREENLLMRV